MSIFKNGINIPKVVQKLELSGYADELEGDFIEVWVNPTRALHQEYNDIQTRILKAKAEGLRLTAAVTDKKDQKEREEAQQTFDEFVKNEEKEIKKTNAANYAWLVVIWGGKEKITIDQAEEIAETSKRDDNGNFWIWLQRQTHAMILAHRNSHLKN